MIIQNLDLTPEQEAFVRGRMETRGYSDPSAVVRDALDQAIEKETAPLPGEDFASFFECPGTEAELDAMLQEGIDSGLAEGDAFARVRRELGLAR